MKFTLARVCKVSWYNQVLITTIVDLDLKESTDRIIKLVDLWEKHDRNKIYIVHIQGSKSDFMS